MKMRRPAPNPMPPIEKGIPLPDHVARRKRRGPMTPPAPSPWLKHLAGMQVGDSIKVDYWDANQVRQKAGELGFKFVSTTNWSHGPSSSSHGPGGATTRYWRIE